jgi:hypothetical protein
MSINSLRPEKPRYWARLLDEHEQVFGLLEEAIVRDQLNPDASFVCHCPSLAMAERIALALNRSAML